ncbi:hypothetical protein HCN44_007376 [Aphidius gifuensis]|uniref:Mitochondrial import receptor subunit TOM22 homolog n=1 Tax=Aphidius gifuensis TaxID=684658 RepID=A0A834XLT8_APHGI|nr:mitochondrial import receptor subunit TOM22 homolog [Aphidius gifuensis]KAF7989066.1 hypothetical protein HCN44_007376 [Aphidius gifuensis]
MATIEEIDVQEDSGMGSSDIHSPEIKSILPDDEEDEEDETIAERLLGLTEMFPEDVRRVVWNLGTGLTSGLKSFYSFSCSATWIMFSSSAILFAPILFEVERSQMEEAQRLHQKQVLLGSRVGTGMAMAPPVPR